MTQGVDWKLRARAVQLYEEALSLYQSENVRGAIEKLLQAEPLFIAAHGKLNKLQSHVLANHPGTGPGK